VPSRPYSDLLSQVENKLDPPFVAMNNVVEQKLIPVVLCGEIKQ